MKTKAFIFDMDGVIIDSEPIHIRVKRDTFAHFGLHFDEKRFSRYMGRTSRELFGDLLRENGRSDLDLDIVVRYKHERYLAAFERGEVAPIEGAVDLIHRLHAAGLPLALATSSWERVMETVLDRFAIRRFFASAISGSTLPASKPDPAIYLLSAERLGVDRHAAARAIERMPQTHMRLEVVRRQGRPCVIDDSYNASPDSMASALDVLLSMSCVGRRVAILGEMAELGSEARRLHGYVGAYAAAKRPDLVVVVGNEWASEMAEAALTMGLPEDRIERVPDVGEACRTVVPSLSEDDLVLVKASRAAGLDALVREVLG